MIQGIEKVLVVGGGIGGIAAAIALLKRGVSVDIAEINPDWTVYGAGLTITGPTLRAFRDLGLLDAIETHGFLSRGSHHYLYDGTLLAESDATPVEAGLPSAGGIMRPKLHQIMIEEVQSLGAKVRLGVTLDTFVEQDDGMEVHFTDGDSARYDLVVGADGIYSKLRGKLFDNPVEPVYSGQMSWRVIAPRPAEMNVGKFYFGHANVGGIVPCSQDEVYGFVLSAVPDPRRISAAEQPAVIKEMLRDFGGHMAEIRDGVTEDSSIVQRPFEYALQPLPWHKGRIVLIGDAVHATTPHLASGAGIAVEDALVLAQELEKAGGNVEGGLQAFEQRRFERCKMVIDSSVEICNRQLAGAPSQEIGQLMGKAMHRLGEAI